MKIVCVSKYAAIPKYGNYTRHFSFCKEWVKLGHDVTLISTNSHIAYNVPDFEGDFLIEYIDGVRIIWIKMPKYKSVTGIIRVLSWFLFEWRIRCNYKKLELKDVDIIYCSSLSLLSAFTGMFFKRKFGSKLVFEVRDIWPLSLTDLMDVSSKHPLVLFLKWVEKKAYSNADLIVGTMPGLSLHVEKVIKEDFKCICIPQGLDVDFYTNGQEKIDDEFVNKYFPNNKFTVTYAGALGVSYALDKVIDAARRLSEDANNIHFLFLGSGNMMEELKKQAADLHNVTFVPKIQKNKVVDFLSKSSLLLHSFQMKPIFEYGISPNKFVDYMYSGRPIIVMFSGYQSLINESGCGEFIPSEDSDALVNKIMEYYYKSEEELNYIGSKGKQFALDNLAFDKLSKVFLEEIVKS